VEAAMEIDPSVVGRELGASAAQRDEQIGKIDA
jgi:hypothetical protein